MLSVPSIHLLLFVDTELARAHVHDEEETAPMPSISSRISEEQGGYVHDGEDLEKVVLGKVLVWVMWVQLAVVR